MIWAAYLRCVLARLVATLKIDGSWIFSVSATAPKSAKFNVFSQKKL